MEQNFEHLLVKGIFPLRYGNQVQYNKQCIGHHNCREIKPDAVQENYYKIC